MRTPRYPRIQALASRRLLEIFPRRENSAAQQFFADGAAYLVHPQRPGVFREAEEMPRAMIVGAGEVVDAEQHQARGPARCIERRGAGRAKSATYSERRGRRSGRQRYFSLLLESSKA